MKFTVFGKMHSNPSMKINAAVAPVDVNLSAEGGLEGRLGPFGAEIGEIPIHLAIPFLRRRGSSRVVVAAFGGFRIRLEHFHVSIERARFDLNGTIGQNGIRSEIDCKVACSTEMHARGAVSGRVGISHLDLGEQDDEHPGEFHEPHKDHP